MNIRNAVRGLRALVHYPYYERVLKGVKGTQFPIFVNYPVLPEPRYGFGKPPHQSIKKMMEDDRLRFQEVLSSFLQFDSWLLAIPENAGSDLLEPYWKNAYFQSLDAIALYCFLALRNPGLYIEIGSGNSTKFAKRAIRDHNLRTRIVSVDPAPRVEIDQIADEVIRTSLESTDLSLFNDLTGNDILFFDGSHRSFMNSDVTVFFLDVMPIVPSDALVHIHDIYLPNDYPRVRAGHYESEQYLLAAMLLGGCSQYETVLPNNFIEQDPVLSGTFADLHRAKKIQYPTGCSFWLKRV